MGPIHKTENANFSAPVNSQYADQALPNDFTKTLSSVEISSEEFPHTFSYSSQTQKEGWSIELLLNSDSDSENEAKIDPSKSNNSATRNKKSSSITIKQPLKEKDDDDIMFEGEGNKSSDVPSSLSDYATSPFMRNHVAENEKDAIKKSITRATQMAQKTNKTTDTKKATVLILPKGSDQRQALYKEIANRKGTVNNKQTNIVTSNTMLPFIETTATVTENSTIIKTTELMHGQIEYGVTRLQIGKNQYGFEINHLEKVICT